MKIECEMTYGVPVYRGIAIIKIEEPTRKDIIKNRLKQVKLYIKRMFGLLN